MAYVSVPKDLNRVKTKVLFNLTKRQLICIAIAAAIGIPFYFLTRGALGTSNAATGMVWCRWAQKRQANISSRAA